jgi:hypothetical protein
VVRIARLAPRRASLGFTADRSRNLRPIATGLWRDGAGYTGNDPALFFGLPVLVAGTLLGWSLYGKLDEAAFRKVVLVLLLVSGLAIVATGR